MGRDKKEAKPAGKGGKKGAEDDKKEVPKLKGAQSINVRHILTEKKGKSDEAIERLRNGEKFDVVAREMSEDKAGKGWKNKGTLDPDFEKVAFELEESSVTKPKWVQVKTVFGYHVIMVEGRK